MTTLRSGRRLKPPLRRPTPLYATPTRSSDSNVHSLAGRNLDESNEKFNPNPLSTALATSMRPVDTLGVTNVEGNVEGGHSCLSLGMSKGDTPAYPWRPELFDWRGAATPRASLPDDQGQATKDQ
jgi:hypothetical protein